MLEIEKLLNQIEKSPSTYHVVETLADELALRGYIELSEGERWWLKRGTGYFVRRNHSSILAFRIPEAGSAERFLLSAAHSDSPSFKLKENPTKKGKYYVQLSTEKYGGMLMAPWFDRPLTVAGRVFVMCEGEIAERLVYVDRDLLVIPSVAIHMNRNANEGMKYNAHVDTLPLYGDAGCRDVMELVADCIGVESKDILGHDLYLVCRGRGTLVGAESEYVLSPRLDDLECAFGCMDGFLRAKYPLNALPVCCVFDNEEVGSATKQGAGSTFLRDTLRRISLALGMDEEAYLMALSASRMVSADNAHAIHPNHPEYADGDNAPVLNKGIVLKFNANQRYTTDGRSAAWFRAVCEKAEVPVQVMANRSDLQGGSTLGSIANTLVSVSTVDIGLPQLAMHSAWETAGARDYESLCKAMKCFYEM